LTPAGSGTGSFEAGVLKFAPQLPLGQFPLAQLPALQGLPQTPQGEHPPVPHGEQPLEQGDHPPEQLEQDEHVLQGAQLEQEPQAGA
jgi:hypothetical protein